MLLELIDKTNKPDLNRLQSYQKGLENLLKKCDRLHGIKNSYIYYQLSLQRKEDLLSQIALKTFEQGNYFFQQKEIEQYICDYIRNLLDAPCDLETLHLDSLAVLQSIEANGLLVKAKKNYSFCDRRFHQYYVAREIITSPDPQTLEKYLQNLVNHINDIRWREVFLLVVGMLPNSDYLLKLIKHQTDALVASDEKLQTFLAKNYQKSNSGIPYKPAAFRAISIAFVLNIDPDARNLDTHLAYDFSFKPTFVRNTHIKNCHFSKQQKQVLKQYYDANKLLWDCLVCAHYVSRTVREELEKTLLVNTAHAGVF